MASASSNSFFEAEGDGAVGKVALGGFVELGEGVGQIVLHKMEAGLGDDPAGVFAEGPRVMIRPRLWREGGS